MCQKGSMRISNILVHTVYYDTHDLVSITYYILYDKEKCKKMEVIISYLFTNDSNAFLFKFIGPKIRHSQVWQDQVSYMYTQVVAH